MSPRNEEFNLRDLFRQAATAEKFSADLKKQFKKSLEEGLQNDEVRKMLHEEAGSAIRQLRKKIKHGKKEEKEFVTTVLARPDVVFVLSRFGGQKKTIGLIEELKSVDRIAKILEEPTATLGLLENPEIGEKGRTSKTIDRIFDLIARCRPNHWDNILAPYHVWFTLKCEDFGDNPGDIRERLGTRRQELGLQPPG